jgi:hypothetical protein
MKPTEFIVSTEWQETSGTVNKELQTARIKEPPKTFKETNRRWGQKGSASGPTPWLLDDDNDHFYLLLLLN